MSTLKVDGIRSNSASSDAITLASDGTCTANITNNLSNRNLVINGAMQVAQRGTSSTTSGYGDVDRWQHEYAGTDEAPTFAQVEVVSSDSGDNPFAIFLCIFSSFSIFRFSGERRTHGEFRERDLVHALSSC